jgi:hypothetical protein
MRYYEIIITPPSGNGSIEFPTIKYSTLNNSGGTNGSALQVELDIFQAPFHQPAQNQNSYIKISGIEFKNISQYANLNPNNGNSCGIKVYVGMSKGLPYANPKQSGIIIDGAILQAWANWQGNQTSLEIIITGSVYNPPEDINLYLNWTQGQTLEQAVRESLNNAYKNPLIPINGSFSPNLIYTETQASRPMPLIPFSQYINQVSKQINPSPNYVGATIARRADGFFLSDGTSFPDPIINVEFQDIIGNLTWIDTAIVQAKLVMRADLNIGQMIIFPKGIPFINTAGSFAAARTNVNFGSGKFIISSIRYNGNSRQADGNSWCVIVDCIVQGANLQ